MSPVNMPVYQSVFAYAYKLDFVLVKSTPAMISHSFLSCILWSSEYSYFCFYELLVASLTVKNSLVICSLKRKTIFSKSWTNFLSCMKWKCCSKGRKVGTCCQLKKSKPWPTKTSASAFSGFTFEATLYLHGYVRRHPHIWPLSF